MEFATVPTWLIAVTTEELKRGVSRILVVSRANRKEPNYFRVADHPGAIGRGTSVRWPSHDQVTRQNYQRNGIRRYCTRSAYAAYPRSSRRRRPSSMKMRSTNSPIKTIASNAPAEDCSHRGMPTKTRTPPEYIGCHDMV